MQAVTPPSKIFVEKEAKPQTFPNQPIFPNFCDIGILFFLCYLVETLEYVRRQNRRLFKKGSRVKKLVCLTLVATIHSESMQKIHLAS